MTINRLAFLMALALLTLAGPGTAFSSGDVITDADGKVVLEDVSAQDIPELVQLLGGDTVAAGQAGSYLIGYGEESMPALIGALGSGPGTKRIIDVLGALADARAVGPLSGYINDADWPTANSARSALAAIGEPAVGPLLGMLKDPKKRDAAIDTLRRISPSAVSLAALRPMLESADNMERSGAAVVAGMWKDGGSEAALVKLVKDDNAAVRRDALVGYGYLHASEPGTYNQQLLAGMLSDTDADVRLQAAQLLTRMDNRDIVPVLVGALGTEKDDRVRERLVMCVEETGDARAVQPLLGILREENPPKELLGSAIYALGRLGAKEAVPGIIELVTGKRGREVRIQRDSFLALAGLGEQVDMEKFIPFLKTGDPNTTATTELLTMMDRLAKPGDEALITSLEDYIKKETNPYRLELAGRILTRIRQ